ncbi:polymorphic toxin-type HINT domain-containing protein [Gloeobacter violaceus]|uniref:polymorphic toxin-type HINT domain-containing protein n=1 Tax=Gloeobacter violaceus TaxID=33072 RepID=UPI0013E89AC5|nr:polymorphic toxin-type HINT domain-containing protein [Gloeobacter violaceus]
MASGLALVPFGGFAKAGVGLLKARTGLSRGIVAASRACGCFAEGTEVQTETGAKPIELVAPGEKVLARNEQTGEQTLRRVKSTFQFDNRPVYRLELREIDGNGDRDVLTVTGEHPFFLQGQGWTAADKLQVGERVQTVDGQWLRVAGLQAQEQKQRTYNLEVERDHTFFVGDSKAWVHNECPSVVTEEIIRAALQDAPLKTLQGSISLPVVERYVRLLEAGSTPPAIKVADGVIIDGNHRYVAGRIFGTVPPQIPGVLRAGVKPKALGDLKIDIEDYGSK